MSTTAMKADNPDSFQMKWGLLDCGVESTLMTLPNLHFALQRWLTYYNFKHDVCKNKWQILPLTWCGKPICDKTRTYWNWGYIKFHEEDIEVEDMLFSEDCDVKWKYYTTTVDQKLRLVTYIVNDD